MMFWKKKQPKKQVDAKALALQIKGDANAIVQDFTYSVDVEELTTLIAVISYVDTFILRCLEGSKIKHKIWIGIVLLKAIKTLARSRKPQIRSIVVKLAELEYLIRGNNDEK